MSKRIAQVLAMKSNDSGTSSKRFKRTILAKPASSKAPSFSKSRGAGNSKKGEVGTGRGKVQQPSKGDAKGKGSEVADIKTVDVPVGMSKRTAQVLAMKSNDRGTSSKRLKRHFE